MYKQTVYHLLFHPFLEIYNLLYYEHISHPEKKAYKQKSDNNNKNNNNNNKTIQQ